MSHRPLRTQYLIRYPAAGLRIVRFWGTHAPGAHMCAGSRLPLELLRICRRVYSEALEVLLHTNRFVIRASAGHPEILAPLAALVRITSLNYWPCPWGHDEIRKSPRRLSIHCCLCSTHSSEADTALSYSFPTSLQMLARCVEACLRPSWVQPMA